MSGTIQNDVILVGRSLLVADLARFADHAKSAPLNEHQVHDAVAAAEFLGDAELLKQTRELIPHTPRFHLVPRPDYPPLSLEQLVAGIHRMAEQSPMLKCCLRGDYAAAFQLADCPRAIEDIAV